jgi:hypothetical protein
MTIEAENPRARIGGNFPPEETVDERAPPKHLRIITPEDAQVFRVIVRMAATRAELAKWRVLEKRKGGEEGRTLRGMCICYMRGIGFQVWKLEKMWGLNRKQIGLEESDFIAARAANDIVDANAERFETMLDAALAIELEEFMSEAAAEIEAVIACRRAVKSARSEAKKLAAANPPPPKPKHVPTEAEKLRDAANARHKIEALEASIRINHRVIVAADQPGAGKDAKRDAIKAAKEIEAAHAEVKKLKRLKAA